MKMKLISAELKEGASGFPYVVCQFQTPLANKRLMADAPVITLNKTAPWSACNDEQRKDTEVRNRIYADWLKANWIDDPSAKEDDYELNSWSVEVEPFLRLDTTTNKWDTKTVYDHISIFDFCNEDGEPLRGMAAIEKRAQNMLANSKRMITVAEFKKRVEEAKKRKAIKEEKKSQSSRLASDDMEDLDIPLD